MQLVTAITELVENKTWRPGDKLPNEIDLAASFDVSRNIMREAMKILENFGILESKTGIGTFISSGAIASIRSMHFFNELRRNTSVEKILETRLIIEPELAYYACVRSTDEEIAQLEKLVMAAVEASKIEYTSDFNFHAHLARLSRNDILANLVFTMLEQLKQESYMHFERYVVPHTKDSSISDHVNILAAMKKRDALLVKNLMHEHLFIRIKVINTSYDTDLALSMKIAEKRNEEAEEAEL